MSGKNKKKKNKPIAVKNNGGTRGDRLLVQQEIHSGPLPAPQVLEGYERICPGAAERIIAMAEAQGRHRQQMERETLAASVEWQNKMFAEARRGQFCALAIGMAAIITGGLVVAAGHPVSGSILGGSGVAGLVSAFIYDRKNSSGTAQTP
jgi:uncharacterized membrane protein